jgi:hypothetical protein
MFELSHSTDGADKSFVTRIKVKGKAAIRHSGSLRLKWSCRKVQIGAAVAGRPPYRQV